MDLKNIYILGDSFSAGAELSDHTFNSYKVYNPKNIKEYLKWFHSIEHQNELSLLEKPINEIEKTKAWPAKLQKITDSFIINSSFGGTSPSTWRSYVFRDFFQFQKDNISIDTAIIQITDVFRTTLYKANKNSIIDCGYSPYILDFGSEDEKSYYKSIVRLQDDIGFFYSFLLDLANIKTTLNYFGVKNIKIVSSHYINIKDIYLKYLKIKIANQF